MPIKGMFTQGLCVLFKAAPTLDQLAAALSDVEVRKRNDSSGEWAFGGPTLNLGVDIGTGGTVLVDIVGRPWPDHMGDPKTEPTLFGAWSMGHFGPFAFPGGLERAGQQCWAWEAGRTVAASHKAFVRVRTSFAIGAAPDDPVLPEDYDPLAELEVVTQLALSLLDVSGSLCYFNPGGEVLRDRESLVESLEFGEEHDLPTLDLWSNVRLFRVDEQWSLMDTVGNDQLDIPDQEACVRGDVYDFREVDGFLRNVSLYLLREGEVVEDGDTMDGPGDIPWKAHILEAGLSDPPRRVLRWIPEDGHSLPDLLSVDTLPD